MNSTKNGIMSTFYIGKVKVTVILRQNLSNWLENKQINKRKKEKIH